MFGGWLEPSWLALPQVVGRPRLKQAQKAIPHSPSASFIMFSPFILAGWRANFVYRSSALVRHVPFLGRGRLSIRVSLNIWAVPFSKGIREDHWCPFRRALRTIALRLSDPSPPPGGPPPSPVPPFHAPPLPSLPPDPRPPSRSPAMSCHTMSPSSSWRNRVRPPPPPVSATDPPVFIIYMVFIFAVLLTFYNSKSSPIFHFPAKCLPVPPNEPRRPTNNAPTRTHRGARPSGYPFQNASSACHWPPLPP